MQLDLSSERVDTVGFSSRRGNIHAILTNNDGFNNSEDNDEQREVLEELPELPTLTRIASADSIDLSNATMEQEEKEMAEHR